jgi:hypothetical protein
MLWTHSNVLGSFQCFGTNPAIPLPLIQHLQCVIFLGCISKLLDFFPIVPSPFGLVVKFLFFPVPFRLCSFCVPTSSQCLLFPFVILLDFYLHDNLTVSVFK